MFKHIDLCSGIGGFALGFEWAGLSRPVMFCDIEPWSRKILNKHWPDVPIEEDVKVLANEPEKIPAGGGDTILTAGYPCQPFSHAGKRRGEEDDRHIWPYIREIVAHKRPSWVVFENVYGHVSMGLDTVLSNLEADGYATRAHIVPACGVDAPHKRDRIWIVGNTESIGRHGWAEEAGRTRQTHKPDEPRPEVWGKPSGPSEDVAYANSAQPQRGRVSSRIHAQHTDTDRRGNSSRWEATQFWLTEPSVGRVAHGIPGRVDRLKGLGNAIVPQIAMQIGIAIRQCEADAIRQFNV